jgi:hypothetical protein
MWPLLTMQVAGRSLALRSLPGRMKWTERGIFDGWRCVVCELTMSRQCEFDGEKELDRFSPYIPPPFIPHGQGNVWILW